MMSRCLHATWMVALGWLTACGGAPSAPEPVPPVPEFRTVASDTPIPAEYALSDSDRAIPPDEVVYFAFDSADLTPQAREDLRAVARWLQENPDKRLGIAGYADRIGSADYNLALSVRRSLAVESFLEEMGVDRERLDVYAHGERDAIAQYHAVNRRVIVYATDSDTADRVAHVSIASYP